MSVLTKSTGSFFVSATVLLLMPSVARPAGAAEWSREFVLKDVMRIYDFPEERVSYALKFPARQVTRRGLEFFREGPDGRVSMPFQLSDVVEAGGFLKQATFSFRGSLKKSESRRFRLSCDPARPAAKPKVVPAVVLRPIAGGVAVLTANRLRVKVPYGRRNFPTAVPLTDVPAPILGVARGERPEDWCLAGSFAAGSRLKVIGVQADVEESGPLFVRYRVTYTFQKGQQYAVVLTLDHNERHVTVDEFLGGVAPQDEAYLEIDMAGVDPDHREVMTNGGYGSQGYCGAFDKKLGEDGLLPYELGLNRPNPMGVMRATADGHSLLLCCYRLRDWKTVYRHVWYSNTGPGNLRFYSRDGRKFLRTRLEGHQRHWALSLIPRDQQLHIRNTPGTGAAATS